MRNLRNTRRDHFRTPGDLVLTASGWDTENDSIICTFGPTRDDPLIQLKRWYHDLEEKKESLENIASWDAPCPLPDLECDNVLDLRYFPDSSTTCVVLAGGDIVVVREAPSDGEDKIEIVGSVDVGISAAAWSPDEELLALVTRADTLLYMTKDFDNISSVTLAEDDLKVSKHVSVGWGKKETQFKGKGVKALRDPTMPEKVDKGLPSSHDDKTSTISWRGDGAYVAVNSSQASTRRVIRVYSREGVLDGVSEPVDGLEGALSWRPEGNLLAGIQRFEDRVDVVFFERNGLRHGQFPLRIETEEMTYSWATSVTLKWNVDSSILAVCFRDRFQLWTMGNYHYYMKQEVVFAIPPSHKRLIFEWNPELPLVCTTTSEGKTPMSLSFVRSYNTDSIHRLEYVIHVDVGSTISPDDYGVISVVDGKEVKLTPLRLANVPPPMALYEVAVESNVVNTAIYGGGSNTKVAVLERDRLSIYQWNLKTKPVLAPVLLASAETAACQGYVQQVVFLDDEQVLVLAANSSGSTVSLFRLTATDLRHFITSLSIPLTQSLCSNFSRLNNIPCLHFSLSGRVTFARAILEPGSGLSPDSSRNAWNDICILPKQTREVKIIDLWNKHTENKPGHAKSLTMAFGLTSNGSLYANSRRLAKDCTSFLVTPAHLIFTTTQHLLKFVHMDRVEELEVPPDTPEIDERCRSIERGARLLTVMPSISALVLQMPRGNLETIYPRALVLAGIRQNIDEKKYKKAFLSCRSHRVDMNILHDHDPESFVKNVDLFVDQVGKVEHIDLFLSQLREEDVSKTMYKDTVMRLQPELDTQNSTVYGGAPGHFSNLKINNICDAFLEALQLRASTNLQNIITAHVCKSPPDLEAGLLEVAKLQRDDAEEAEKAVEHICFLVDVNRLYDNALGLYDLELALLIAQQSQKDPREYLPFLQKLQELPSHRKEFTIDDYLGRYTKALTHIHAINDFEEFKLYMTKHKLYEDALHIYRRQEDRIQGLMGLYADYLLKEAEYRKAGIAYEYIRDYASASEAYRLAHLWREALSCAGLIPLEEAQLQSFASTIAGSLQELKDYHSAAIVLQDYLHDLESAARLFCKGYFYANAIRILSINKRPELIEAVVDAGLVEGMGTMTELLAECKAQINAQVPRLRELRIKKVEEPLAFYDGDVNDGMDIPDNVSLAATDASTTGGSLFTRYTNRTGTVGTNATRRTSKNRRREERKRARGKKGSVYEEEYLVNSVGRLIDRVNAVGDEVGRLVVGLMRRGMRERAKAVEGAMVEVVGLCRDCVGEVFQSESKVGQEEEKPKNQDVDRPTGGDGVLWDSMETSQTRKEAPEVKAFEKLALFSR
ncbi:hypothetical protein MMC18_005104 [Xylographa bjoerkii]|nr:hypothetical protein [Xylographa bjoerkii]